MQTILPTPVFIRESDHRCIIDSLFEPFYVKSSLVLSRVKKHQDHNHQIPILGTKPFVAFFLGAEILSADEFQYFINETNATRKKTVIENGTTVFFDKKYYGSVAAGIPNNNGSLIFFIRASWKTELDSFTAAAFADLKHEICEATTSTELWKSMGTIAETDMTAVLPVLMQVYDQLLADVNEYHGKDPEIPPPPPPAPPPPPPPPPVPKPEKHGGGDGPGGLIDHDKGK